MSDDRDETRRSVPPSSGLPSSGRPPSGETGSDDPASTRAGDRDATRAGGLDATRVGGVPADDATVPPPVDDTVLSPVDETVLSPVDETVLSPAGDESVPPPVNDPTVVRRRGDATSVMPPVEGWADDDWAPSRGNSAWSGRAEVRAPVYQEVDDWSAGGGGPEPRGRWWTPIIVGIVALVLLAALGYGIWLIVQNTGKEGGPETPAVPSATTTSVLPTQATSAPPSTAPSTEPATTPPEPTLTTEPTTVAPTTEITIPALRGLPLPQAAAALSKKGLSYRVIYRDENAPAGTVIDSDPAEGQEVPPGTVIALIVAGPSPTATAADTTNGPGAGPN